MAADASCKVQGILPQGVGEKIAKAIEGISYGSITIIVQDAKVIQIEINEKIRLC